MNLIIGFHNKYANKKRCILLANIYCLAYLHFIYCNQIYLS
jgi:hypothetical protein